MKAFLFQPSLFERTHKNITLFLGVIVLFLVSHFSYAQPPSHDPSSMIRNTDGRYWIFTTGGGIWCMSSSNNNFTDWRAERTPYTSSSYPSWIRNYAPEFKGEFWAPEVVNVNNQFRLYYSATSKFGSKLSCIGLATASSLYGPWTDQGMVVYSNNNSSENAIDPAIHAGKWMSYGSFFGGIKLAELGSNGKPINGNRPTLATGDAEAPFIMQNGGYYYLFINRGRCCDPAVYSSYNIQVGRSTNIAGPYVDKNGRSLTNGGGSQVARTTGRYIGPGHFGYGNGKVTYHFYDGNNNGAPKLRITTLSWSNGWPVISGGGARLDESKSEELIAEVSEIISTYPNPARENVLGISTTLQTKSAVKINLVNLKGQQVYSEDLGIREAGELSHEVNISSLPKGTYIVRVSSGNGIKTAKVIRD